MMIHHHFSLVTAFNCAFRETAAVSWPAWLCILSSVTRSRVKRNCRKAARAVKMAMASMARNHIFTSSFSTKDTRMGNTMLPAPMTPMVAILAMEAMALRFSLLRVETAIRVELAVL